jgi:hypothetical protein
MPTIEERQRHRLDLRESLVRLDLFTRHMRTALDGLTLLRDHSPEAFRRIRPQPDLVALESALYDARKAHYEITREINEMSPALDRDLDAARAKPSAAAEVVNLFRHSSPRTA